MINYFAIGALDGYLIWMFCHLFLSLTGEHRFYSRVIWLILTHSAHKHYVVWLGTDMSYWACICVPSVDFVFYSNIPSKWYRMQCQYKGKKLSRWLLDMRWLELMVAVFLLLPLRLIIAVCLRRWTRTAMISNKNQANSNAARKNTQSPFRVCEKQISVTSHFNFSPRWAIIDHRRWANVDHDDSKINRLAWRKKKVPTSKW